MKKKETQNVDDTQEKGYNDIVPEEEEGLQMKGKSEKKLREELKECRGKAQEYLEGWQRAKADFINFKREAEEEKKRFATFAAEGIIHELLPVMDSFDMVLASEAFRKDDPWTKGVGRIYAQLLSALEAQGVGQINPLHERFDPNAHDSIGIVPTDAKKEGGVILEVVQKGYELGGKLIRAAKVKVGEYRGKS